MNVNYTARQMQLTPEIKQFCDRKLRSLRKLLGSVFEVDIILSVEKRRNKAEINLKAKGGNVVMVEESPDMINSLNIVFDNLERKIKKEREKFREQKRWRGREKKAAFVSVEPEETGKKIVRSDYYSLKPMPLEEALFQFDVNKREVFVFRKLGSEKWAVVYRRKDGNYGLVEPEG
jgi:putative sigma-54 modulation protein